MDWERITKKMMEQSLKEGEAGAAKARAQKAMFAQQLQDRRNMGTADVATIGQEGQDRRLASTQAYGKPAQTAAIAQMGAETEGTRVGTEGKRFYQKLTEEYGRDFMKAQLREAQGEDAEQAPDTPVSPTQSDVALPGMGGVANLPALPGMSSILAETPTDPAAQPGGVQDWESFTRTPVGRSYGLPGLTEQVRESGDVLKRGYEGLSKGLRYLFTPTEKKKKEVASLDSGMGVKLGTMETPWYRKPLKKEKEKIYSSSFGVGAGSG